MLAEEFGDMFVTAKNAHLRWHDGRLHVVLGSAGHPGPVLVRPDGRTTIMNPGGLPLGLFPTVEAEAGGDRPGAGGCAVLLHRRGDRGPQSRADLLRGPSHRRAGFVAWLYQAPRDIVAGLQSLVVEFCRNELRDDMTMLVLRVAEPPDQ